MWAFSFRFLSSLFIIETAENNHCCLNEGLMFSICVGGVDSPVVLDAIELYCVSEVLLNFQLFPCEIHPESFSVDHPVR